LRIVWLDSNQFTDVAPSGLGNRVAKAIFWALSIAGWILGSFLVAGFAGLTQKSS
jgi:hypothetical protein